ETGARCQPGARSRLCARAWRHRRLNRAEPNEERAGPMAIDAPSSSSSFYALWPDRLRHSAIILLAAGLALAVVVAFGELSLVRAVAVFACIAAAALVPWRLHDAAASREDVRGVNPVESAAVSALVAGMPDPAV